MSDVIKCLNGSMHQHFTVAAAISCLGTKEIYVTNVPPTGNGWAPTGPTTEPAHTRTVRTDSPTANQLSYLASLGGDADYARDYKTKGEVSHEIKTLVEEKRLATLRPETRYLEPINPMPAPSSPAVLPTWGKVPPVSPDPEEDDTDYPPINTYSSRAANRKSLFEGPFLDLLKNLPEGNFAVREEEGEPITFVRVSRPKTGRYKDCIKIQTMHSEVLTTRWVAWPSGRISCYSHIIEDVLMLLITSYREYARLYSKEIGKCSRCNTKLTDERSRYFGVGPECEKYWPWMITEVRAEAEENGEVSPF